MKKTHDKGYRPSGLSEQQIQREGQRLIAATALLALNTSIVFLVPDILVNEYISLLVKFAFGASALLSGLYLLLTASFLKYREPGFLGPFKVIPGLRKASFDLAVEAFGTSFYLVLINFTVFLLGYILNISNPRIYLMAYFISGLLLVVICSLNYKLFNRFKDNLDKY